MAGQVPLHGLTSVELYALWEAELCQIVREPDPVLVAACEVHAEARGVRLPDVVALLAFGNWRAELHPRGKDGKFIEVGGIIRMLFGDHHLGDHESRGVVKDILPGDGPDGTKIRVSMLDDLGHDTGKIVDVLPNEIEQVPRAKAHLDVPNAPNVPNAPLHEPHVPSTELRGEALITRAEDGTIITSPEARAMAADIYAAAVKAEPEITQRLIDITGDTEPGISGRPPGAVGDFHGFNNRLKKEETIAEKIERIVADKKMTREGAGKDIKDAVRYTIHFDSDVYGQKGQELVDALRADNASVNVKNTWAPDSDYKGLNLQVIRHDGVRFEVQVHTPESQATKDRTHGLYEEQRVLPASDPRVAELDKEMKAIAGALAIPPGAEDIGKERAPSTDVPASPASEASPFLSPGEDLQQAESHLQDAMRRHEDAYQAWEDAKAEHARDPNRVTDLQVQALQQAMVDEGDQKYSLEATVQRLRDEQGGGTNPPSAEASDVDGHPISVGSDVTLDPGNSDRTDFSAGEKAKVNEVWTDDAGKTWVNVETSDPPGSFDVEPEHIHQADTSIPESPGSVAEPYGGPNVTTLAPGESESLANQVMAMKEPIVVNAPNIDDVVDHFADGEEPVDLTLLSEFAAMRENGIPRILMPQISHEHTKAFQDRLTESNIKFENSVADPADLSATQSELDGRTVGGILRDARIGKFDLHRNPIWISSDNKVLDGHHRWAAAKSLSTNCPPGVKKKGCPVEIPVIRVDMPMDDLLAFANQFNDDMGVPRQAFGEPHVPDASVPGVPTVPGAPSAAPAAVAAALAPPEPDKDGYYEMATDEEDGVKDEDLANLPHGDGSAFPKFSQKAQPSG